MFNLLFDKFYIIVLVTLFIYLPLETIAHGIDLNILPPSYIFIFIFSTYAFFYLFDSMQKHHFDFIIHAKISFTITILILLLIFISRMLGELEYINPKELNIHTAYFLSYTIFGYVLAVNIGAIEELFKAHRNTITTIFFLFVLLYFSLLLYSNSYNIYASLLGFSHKIQYAGIHLSTSSIIAVFLLWQMNQTRKWALLYFIIGLIILFTLGSRSALAFYILVSFITLFRLYGFERYLLLLAVVTLILYLNIDTITALLQQRERMYALFTLDLKDTSLLEREAQITNNLVFIKENLFLGKVMGELLVNGKGTYIHSYLSYLQNYGIIIFLLLNLLIIKISYYYIKNLFSHNRFFHFMGVSFIFITLEFLFSRAYTIYHLFTFLIIFEVYFYQYNTRQTAIFEEVSHV
jgi:hypothetical protein